jgi:membrane-associated protein
MHLDVQFLVKSLGYFSYLAIWGIIFAESGLLIGFFLPGDSLLVAAGFAASQNLLNIWVLIIGCFICAVLGDNVGYVTGSRFGRRLFQKEDSKFFKKEYLARTQSFYEKYGKKTIVLARFVPIVRTFAPIIAGVSGMKYKTFMTYNLVGGFVWTFGITSLGYFIGNLLPAEQVDKYLLPIIAVVILVSLLPSVIHVIQENRANRR